MAIIKCKMCGGDMELSADKTFGTCEYCGSTMTLPKIDDEQRAAAFNRGNHFRRMGDFDKALAVYELIVQEDDSDAEAHWCCALCRFGIEYVEDPASYEYLPTCHRASFDSFLEDVDYLAAVEHSEGITKRQYQKDAAKIAEVQRGILATSHNEEPFDVFICYKETDDATKERTRDSLDAQEIYYQLTQEGYRVFFSRITLEDKAGTEYEPYIFAALNSAKVMIALGSKPEYFNAVWVKNEWSRFLSLMKKDRSKLLLPCYKNMDPYDLPEQLSVLQSYDMAKIGFTQDLLRGIKKVIAKEEPQKTAKETVVVQQTPAGSNSSALLKRGKMALEDGEWEKADGFFEEVLNQDAENAEAYLGKLLVSNHMPNMSTLFAAFENQFEKPVYETLIAGKEDREHINHVVSQTAIPHYLSAESISELYQFDFRYSSALSCRKQQRKQQQDQLAAIRPLNRARQYATGAFKAELDGKLKALNDKLNARVAQAEAEDAESIKSIQKAYADHQAKADQLAEKNKRAAEEKREKDYQHCEKRFAEAKTKEDYSNVLSLLKKLEDYREAPQMRQKCTDEASSLAFVQRLESEKAAKKRKKAFAIGTLIVAACIAFIIVLTTVIIPNSKYNAAIKLMNDGKYEEAISAFEALDGYKDSADKILDSAVSLLNDGKIIEAYDSLIALNGYKDSATKASEIFGQYKIEKLKIAEVGDIVYFGTYEQDNNTSNGKEDVEWIVLAKEGNKILVISKYALDCQQYNTEWEDITWESCSLRKWMNDMFLNNAFSAEEQAQIQNTNVSADKNPEYSTNPGNATTDKVFLLSITEAEKYFPTEKSRRCAPTAYAKAQGALKSDSDKTASGEAACGWWFRSPGDDQYSAAYVGCCGGVGYYGNSVDCDVLAVRPALWINLDS